MKNSSRAEKLLKKLYTTDAAGLQQVEDLIDDMTWLLPYDGKDINDMEPQERSHIVKIVNKIIQLFSNHGIDMDVKFKSGDGVSEEGAGCLPVDDKKQVIINGGYYTAIVRGVRDVECDDVKRALSTAAKRLKGRGVRYIGLTIQ